MNDVTLLPIDMYQVVNKCLLNENDKLVLSMLYMPIIGNTAIALYNTLYNELKANNYVSSEISHHHLITILGETLENIKTARIKLEGIGLLKTYYKKGSINSYVYVLYSPLSVSEFFNHPIFNIVLFNNVGKNEYLRLKNYFQIPKLNLEGYNDITSPFDMTFKSVAYTTMEFIDNIEVSSKNKRGLSFENMFDFDTLISSIPKNLLNKNALTNSVKELITDLSFLYKLNPLEMADIVKVSINELGLIDKEELKKNTRKHYEFSNNGRLPSLVYKSEKTISKKSTNKIDKMINVFETTKPYDFLKSKYKGVKPTNQDMQILEMLIVDLKFPPSVCNVLIDYILKTKDNKLIKRYVETVAGEWKRAGLKTAKEAMEYVEKNHNKLKEMKSKKIEVQKIDKSLEKVPEWFDKNIKDENIDSKVKDEFEEFVKEYV